MVSLRILGAGTLVLFLAAGTVARADDTPDARVEAACLDVYVEGVSEALAKDRVGVEGVPVLLRLLADPTFPRRDNVVAFLWHLGGPESTEPLVHLIEEPPSALHDPEEDRALRLAPRALGHIAAR